MIKRIEIEKLGTFTGHRDCIYSLEPNLEENGFFTSGSDGLVAKWNLSNPDQGTLVAKIPNTVYAMVRIPGEEILVVGQNFEGIHIIDLTVNKEKASLKLTDKAIFDIKFSNGKLYIAVGEGELIKVSYPELLIEKRLKISDQHLRALAVNEQENTLAVGSSDNSITLLDLDTLALKQKVSGHTNSVFALTYDTKYNHLLSGSRDAHMKVWDAQDGYGLKEDIVAHMYTINHIAYRKDGKFFATCSKDKSVKVWDARTFRLLKVIDKARHAGHGTSVNKLLWLSDDELVSCSDDRSISVWKIYNLPE
ncbi:WD40 repeat domain-containing protein [Limibacter armeniacum]|uniref:WD40 repeat domain-containing protein n=1 Tax=Limibacter armeniacum TaxID=466084 RepID=UPI002FE68524